MRRPAAALALLLAACATSPPAERYYREAILSLSANGDSPAPIELLTRALQIDPAHAEALLLRAALYRREGKPAPAIADLTAYLLLNPGDANAFLHRGILHSMTRETEKAEADFAAALERKPHMVEAHLHRGILYRVLGRRIDAEKDFARARKLGKSLAEAFFHKAQKENGKGNLDVARKQLTFAIELDPEYAEAFLERGNVLALLALEREALADFDRAIELSPGNPWGYFFRARIYLEWKLLGDAETDARTMTRLAPSSHAYHLLGTILLEKGDPRKAIAAFRDALAHAGDTDTRREIERSIERAKREEEEER